MTQPDNDDASFSGKRVLVVEDEAIVAMLLEDMLDDLGCKALGPASSIKQALALLAGDATPPDAAILDVNLGGERIYPVAEALAAKNVPIVFATGYGDHTIIPKSLGHIPVVRKPYDPDALASTLARALANDKDAGH